MPTEPFQVDARILAYLHATAPELGTSLTKERLFMIHIILRLEQEKAGLLAACEEALANVEECVVAYGVSEPGSSAPDMVAIELLKSAIAKARGEKP